MAKHSKASEIAHQFTTEYGHQPRYKGYIISCGVSKVGIYDLQARIDDRLKPCLIVYLRKKCSRDLSLPSTYRSLPVFYRIIGDVSPA